MVFKIKANDLGEGLKSDQIKIKIELNTLIASLLGFTLYDTTNTSGMNENYKGLYYFDFGEYPQSKETNSTIINAMSTTADSKDYYTSSVNGKKYARKGTSPNFTYYLVEPVRWLVIGNGGNYQGLPNKNFDGLAGNQFLLLSEKIIEIEAYNSGNARVTWTSTSLYKYLRGTATDSNWPNRNLPLKELLFNSYELNMLSCFEDGRSILSILECYNTLYLHTNYLTNNNYKKAINTNFVSSSNYFLRCQNQYSPAKWIIGSNGGLNDGSAPTGTIGGVRPIIILNV